ncbi:hypothetical protein [Aureliella helgolandensis]|uniref:Uncharacterized protein n=1 Tax=Aureliella helgolandensis TaxID=2527968 RepID=A0A518G2Q4_9BACT|nr:hypothetical protein [Aureliella helgolandensis]QDV22886.1 hypothetical protein Q31a_11790 [Aureliella helgolandensis]
MGTPEMHGRFPAKDREGNEYLLSLYTMVTHSTLVTETDATTDLPQGAAIDQENRVLYILTEDRQLVLRLAKGKYKISGLIDTLLYSDDPQAP